MILEKVTFTGIDELTNINKLLDICHATDIPIEIALLCSSSKAGTDNRYMSYDMLKVIIKELLFENVSIALHLCGKLSKDFMTNRMSDEYSIINHVNTIQCNNIRVKPEELNMAWTHNVHIPYNERISEFTKYIVSTYPQVSVLQDSSGGRGISGHFYRPVLNVQNGFAGGIGPNNVQEKLAEIDSLVTPGYTTWIDMEGQIRDDKDYLDLDKLQQVVEEVENYFE